jgi:glutamate/tyrosine decarboxylase-like PLP-dependent enzyme
MSLSIARRPQYYNVLRLGGKGYRKIHQAVGS